MDESTAAPSATCHEGCLELRHAGRDVERLGGAIWGAEFGNASPRGARGDQRDNGREKSARRRCVK
jgi:hypothetical protein